MDHFTSTSSIHGKHLLASGFVPCNHAFSTSALPCAAGLMGCRAARPGWTSRQQSVRSAMSAAANHAEAGSASSAEQFLDKLKLSLKDLRETATWLHAAQRVGYDGGESSRLRRECRDLTAIFVASVATLQGTPAMIRPATCPLAVGGAPHFLLEHTEPRQVLELRSQHPSRAAGPHTPPRPAHWLAPRRRGARATTGTCSSAAPCRVQLSCRAGRSCRSRRGRRRRSGTPARRSARTGRARPSCRAPAHAARPPRRAAAAISAPVLRECTCSSCSSVSATPSPSRSSNWPPIIPAGPDARINSRTIFAAATVVEPDLGARRRARRAPPSAPWRGPRPWPSRTSNALCTVGRPRRMSSSSMHGRSSCTSE